MNEAYEAVGHELRDRILALIPEHPEIMELEDTFDLFAIEGFDCSDLKPSLAQAGWALGAARKAWSKQQQAAAAN